jgi:hypothetical protein
MTQIRFFFIPLRALARFALQAFDSMTARSAPTFTHKLFLS